MTDCSAKPKLIVVELDYHAEVLTSLIPMLSQVFDVYLMTSAKVWRKANSCEASLKGVAVKKEKQPLAEFMRTTEGMQQRADLVYFNTLEKHLSFFASYQWPCKTIWRLHNLNANLQPGASLAWGEVPKLTVFRRLLVSFLSGRWKAQQKMLSRTDYLMAPSDGIRDAYLKKNPQFAQLNWLPFVLPFAEFQPISPPQQMGGGLVLVVLGSINPKRKDYDFLYSVLVQLAKKSNRTVELHLLGRPKGEAGEAVVSRFKALSNHRIRVLCSGGYVSDEEAAKVVSRSTCLVAPIRLATTFKSYREIYGLTKVSGFENDIRRYGKPCFHPAAYAVEGCLAPLCHGYETADDLVEQLLNYQPNPLQLGAQSRGQEGLAKLLALVGADA